MTGEGDTHAAGTCAGHMEVAGTGDYCGIASTPDGDGCWVVDRYGEVHTVGNASFHGSIPANGITLGAAIVGIATVSTNVGYWLYSAAGDVYSFGDVPSYGTLAEIGYDPTVPVVSMAAHPDARAYCLLNAEGDVFTFGDMKNHGSPRDEGIILAGRAAGIMLAVSIHKGSTPAGYNMDPDTGFDTGFDAVEGYIIVDSEGEVYTFGSAWFHGSIPSDKMLHAAPIIAVMPYESSSQDGYRMVGADGAVYCFDAPFYGAPVGVMDGSTIVAATEDPVNRDGYYLLSNSGEIFYYDINT
jgi:hypothetical protein